MYFYTPLPKNVAKLVHLQDEEIHGDFVILLLNPLCFLLSLGVVLSSPTPNTNSSLILG